MRIIGRALFVDGIWTGYFMACIGLREEGLVASWPALDHGGRGWLHLGLICQIWEGLVASSWGEGLVASWPALLDGGGAGCIMACFARGGRGWLHPGLLC